jgi:hypothetical protein
VGGVKTATSRIIAHSTFFSITLAESSSLQSREDDRPGEPVGASMRSAIAAFNKADREGNYMRSIIAAGLFGLLALSGTPGTSEAKGCLKGAAVGGVAGHMAGHHGAMGAAAGCAVGHHEASKQEQAQQAQHNNGDNSQETR